MANDLALPASFGKPPASVVGANFSNDELGAGVSASYAVMGIKGKVWSVKFGGEETQLMRDDGDGPRSSIEVVIVKASPAISKIFYKDGYVDGANQAPDCWSGNGVAPDPSVKNKVHPTCADCPMNAWGSRTTDAGKNAKACADSRRVAIVPLIDIDNETQGGPMLLRVPAASLKDLKAYGDLLASYQHPYWAAATRIAFDPAEAFPKFVLSAIRPLEEEEVAKVKALRDDKRTATVLAENAATIASSTPAEPAREVPKSPFENGAAVTPKVPPAAETKPVEVKQAAPVEAKPTAKPKAAPAAKAAAAATAAPAKSAIELLKEQLAAAEAEAKAAEEAAKPKVETPQEKVARLRKEAAEALAAAEAEAAAAAQEGTGSTINALLAEGSEDELGGDAEAASEGGEAATPAGFDEMLEGILGD